MIQSLIMDSQPIIPTGAMDNTRKEVMPPATPPMSSSTAIILVTTHTELFAVYGTCHIYSL